jgi:hypothetical protein
MPPRDRRRARRAMIDLTLGAIIIVGSALLALSFFEVTAYQLADEYSRFDFSDADVYPPEEQ